MNERHAMIFDGPIIVLRVSGDGVMRRVRVDLADVWVLDTIRVTEPVVSSETGELSEITRWRASMVGPGGGEIEIDLESEHQAHALVEHWERVRRCSTTDEA